MRALRLSPERRAEIASLGGAARARSMQAARRIEENFRYASAVDELRGRPLAVTRERSFAGVLPGIYPSQHSRRPEQDGLPRRGR